MKLTKALLFTSLLFTVFMFSCANGPEPVAKKFLDAMAKKDFKTMKALSTDDSQKMIGMLESFSSMDTSKAKDKSFAVKNIDVKDSIAKATYCCGSEGKDDTLHLRKTKEGWKVDMSKETLMGGKNVMDALKSSATDPAQGGAPAATDTSATIAAPADTTKK